MEGDVVFSKNETVSTYIYDDEGPESVRRLLGTVASGQIFNAEQVKSGRELIPLDDALERSGFYDIDESAYQRAIDDDLPLFCHQEVATYTTCFVYLDGLTVQILGTGN